MSIDFHDKEQVKAWIRKITHDAEEARKRQIATTTPEQAVDMLHAIIGRDDDPENWTEQEANDMGTLAFVADWIAAQQSKETAHEQN